MGKHHVPIERQEPCMDNNLQGPCDFGFFRGGKLDSSQLEGTGKALRHIKIRSAGEVDEAEIKRLLKKAAENSGIVVHIFYAVIPGLHHITPLQ